MAGIPTLDWNRRRWDSADWTHNDAGEKWSAAWGDSETQWFGSLRFRLHAFMPCNRILEIAPGHGRWTQYLHGECDELDVVDFSPACIEACQKRFGTESGITYFVNDGLSLGMLPGDYDLIFTFDSLVHAEMDVMASYLSQIGDLLSRDGVAFLHHSNMAAYMEGEFAQLPDDLVRTAEFHRIARSGSVDAQRVEQFARGKGLAVIAQELVNWGVPGPRGERLYSDCFSLITRAGSRWQRKKTLAFNDQYMTGEAAGMKRLRDLYNVKPVPG